MSQVGTMSIQRVSTALRWLFLPLLLAGTSLLAAENESIPPGHGLVITPPAPDSALITAALLAVPGDVKAAARAPMAGMTLSDKRLLDPLRQMLLKNDPEDPTDIQCTYNIPPFSMIVSRIEENLAFQDEAAAAVDLRRVDAAFSCDQSPIPTMLLRQYALLAGLESVRRNEGGHGWFALAAELAEEQEWIQQQPDGVRRVYQQESLSRANLPRSRVRAARDLAGLKLLVDGREAHQEELRLLPGAHFVQLVNSANRVVRGGIFLVSADTPEGQPLEDFFARGFFPPTPEQVNIRIQEAARMGRFDPSLLSSLMAILEGGEHPWLVVLVSERGTQPARALWLLPSGSAFPVLLRPGASPEGIVGTATLGALTLGSAAALTQLLSILFSRTPVRNAELAFYSTFGLGSAVILGAGTTLVVASRTWHWPRWIYFKRSVGWASPVVMLPAIPGGPPGLGLGFKF